MAYSAPSITASGTTLAQLKAGGFSGQLERLISANTGLTANQISMIRLAKSGGADRLFHRISVEIGTIASGHASGPTASATHTIAAAEILDHATVLAVWKTALDEIGVLEAAITRTAVVTHTAVGYPKTSFTLS